MRICLGSRYTSIFKRVHTFLVVFSLCHPLAFFPAFMMLMRTASFDIFLSLEFPVVLLQQWQRQQEKKKNKTRGSPYHRGMTQELEPAHRKNEERKD